jgi:hypothetical protein
VKRVPSLTACADPTHELPAGAAARGDQIERALASLRDEERRLMKLGFELPLARCREQRRYWEFLRGVFSLTQDDFDTTDSREIA